MSGKELIDYLVTIGYLQVKEKYDTNSYEDRLTERCIRNLNSYIKDVSEVYKMFVKYFGDTFKVYEILDKIGILLVENKISQEGMKKLISNIDFLIGLGLGSKDIMLNRYIDTINNAKRGKESKIDIYKLTIGSYSYRIKLDHNSYYEVKLDSKGNTFIEVYQYNRVVQVIPDIEYVMLGMGKVDIVGTKEFKGNKQYFLDRDKDRLKIYFVKHI